MATNLGNLTVALGLDSADYTRGLTKAEAEARRFGEEVGGAMRRTALEAFAFIKALDLAGSAVQKFTGSIQALDGFNDLRDSTGASIENISALDKVARDTGATFGTVEGVLTKFNQALNASKGESDASRVLKAINLDTKALKELDPAEALRQTAVAFGQFENDGNKARAMQLLFGRSVKEVAPFLNDLAEQTKLVGTTNSDATQQAEDFNKQLAKLGSNATDAARRITADLLPALNGILKVYANGGLMAALDDFGERAFGWTTNANTKRIARVTDEISKLKEAASGITFDVFGQKDRIAKQIDAKQAELRDLTKSMALGVYGDKYEPPQPPKPSVNVQEKPTKPKTGRNTELQEAKAQLAADLEDIRIAQDALTSGYTNQERILSALRAAGLRDETAYYSEKRDLLAKSTAAQEDGLQKQIERMKQENLSGKDQIDNARKIADAQAKLAKARADSTAQATVYGIEEAAAFKRIEEAILSARQAAQEYLDTTDRAAQRTIDGIGRGSKARDFAAGVSQIEERYQQMRQQAQDRRARAELAGTFGSEQKRKYDADLALIEEFQGKSIESYKRTYAVLDEARSNWLNGASEALANYQAQVQDVASATQGALTNAFKGAEDALVNFVTTGKLDFKSLANSIISDLARIAVQKSVTGPLADVLTRSLNVGIANSSDDPIKALYGLTNGFRASGGPVSAGNMYRVNERGPELLDVNGKQFLMMGNKNGKVIPNDQLGGSGGQPIQVTINNSVGDIATMSMLRESQKGTEQRIAAALGRSQRYGGAMSN